MRGTMLTLSLAVLLAATGCRKEGVAELPPQPAAPAADAGTTTVAKTAADGSTAPIAQGSTGDLAQGSPADAGAAGGTKSAGSLSGTTEAHRRSTLTPKVSSTVTRVHVRDGDLVRAGQPLVTLDTEDFGLRMRQAQAQAESARVARDAAKLEYDRMKALAADKAIPQSQFDMVDAKYKGALAGVTQAETAVAMGQKALRDAVIRAPFSGLVVKRHINEGEYASVMPATALVTLEELNPIDLRIQVPSSELTRIHVGDPIHVRLPALGRELDARITRVVQANDPKTRSFSAVAELPNPDHTLRSGLYAEVVLRDKVAADAAQAPAKGRTRRTGRTDR